MIRVSGLTKRYGDFTAVHGIDFEVNEGEVFGLLGPNGAGKTTTVEILEGLRPRTSGEVSVLGFDPGIQHRILKDRIGVCLQAANFPEKIRVWEAVRLFASFYSRTADGDALLRRLQLWEKRQSFYSHLSGGQKQRLALALALLNDPQLLFLDEPSAGLDPQARLEIHELVLGLRAERRTILLTTHYIEEAERLCDRVAIIDEGRIVALGTPREIQDRVIGASLIEVTAAAPLPEAPSGGWRDCDSFSLSGDRCVLSVRSRVLPATLVDLVKWLDASGVVLRDVRLQRPSLEEAFLELTGKRLRD
ncbi:MAG: ABC transporter ATP-binding protein [Bryobacterales bacterium]|nr:ABC transporter ATP-binding protein [Bryobacterales bacterium]